MLVNTLIHRELTSSYIAKFVIEKNKMYVENANRALADGFITPDNLEPNPKNPIIASFFRNIGFSDQLGSGVRNLYKYTKFYSGREPVFKEGDVFQIMVPLNDFYSYDFGYTVPISHVNQTTANRHLSADKQAKSADKHKKEQEKKILDYIAKNSKITSKEAESLLAVKQRRARTILGKMVEEGILDKRGAYRNTIYILSNTVTGIK